MTTDELVTYISDDLNITGPDSRARIERALNVRYKEVTSAIGMGGTRRVPLTKAATIGSRFITFTGAERLENVYRLVGTRNITLNELTVDEMENTNVRTEPAANYAVYSYTPTTVTLWLDCTPLTAFVLNATGLASVVTLSGTVSPAFPESFHDVLIYAVEAVEYRRKHDKEAAKDAEAHYASRLSDLRMFIAKSGFLDIYRGKHSSTDGWWDTTDSGN